MSIREQIKMFVMAVGCLGFASGIVALVVDERWVLAILTSVAAIAWVVFGVSNILKGPADER